MWSVPVPTKSTRPVFRTTSIGEALAAGVEDLAEVHFAEVEHYGDLFPFKMNWPALQMAERQGYVFSVGAWKKDKLVGYAMYDMRTPNHHLGLKWAFNQSLYMAPEHRGYDSLALLHAGEEEARRRGASLVIQAVKEPNSTDATRSVKLAVLLGRQGYAPFERLFAKVL
jgi:hypothetical protein